MFARALVFGVEEPGVPSAAEGLSRGDILGREMLAQW